MDLNINNINKNDLKSAVDWMENIMYNTYIVVTENYEKFQKDRKLEYLLKIHTGYEEMAILFGIYRILFFSIPSNNYYYKITDEISDIHEKIIPELKSMKNCKI